MLNPFTRRRTAGAAGILGLRPISACRYMRGNPRIELFYYNTDSRKLFLSELGRNHV